MQRSTLKTEMGNVFGSGQAGRFDTWINASLDQLVAMRTWSFRMARKPITLVAGQAGYPLSVPTVAVPDFGGIIDVSLEMTTGGFAVPLTAADPQVYDRVTKHNTVNGTPMLYCVTAAGPANVTPGSVAAGGQLELRVSPRPTIAAGQGQTLDVLYWRTLEALKPIADSDSLIGPGAFGWAVYEYAVAYGMASIGNLPNAQFWLQKAKERLGPLVTQDEAINPARDMSRLVLAAPPNLSGPTAGQISPQDLTLPVPRQGGQ